MAGAVRRPLVTRLPRVRRPLLVAWVVALAALLASPALFPAATARAAVPASLG